MSKLAIVTGALAVTGFLLMQSPAAAHQKPTGSGTAATGQTGSGHMGAGQAGAGAAKTEGKAVADHPFVMEAASGGMMEVELGKMAVSQASSEDVKRFGQRMVDDHGKANDELKALAQQKGIDLPSQLNKKHQAMRDHLSKLSGAEFDKAYMQHMVQDHHGDVAAFQHEAKMGKDADVKAWAGKTVPTLEEHLKLAKETASKVGATTAAGKKPAGKKSTSGKK